ncbi:hypothetical protein NQ318_018697 [Aromia moschata]|uniref:Ig-like domain-containing protein n=1 Tax=Aromia moschata TaxID=1265417 RepID=A0AAV8ZHK2_9CUCU|nr:hypothetical protein NQ318_018697 [Aromia moschata]
MLSVLQMIGCDLRIGSTKQVDECGVCGGDGSSCSRPLYHWNLAYTSLCSTTCGGGYKMSRPVCQNRVTGDEVEEELCNDSQRPDSTVVECNVHSCPPNNTNGVDLLRDQPRTALSARLIIARVVFMSGNFGNRIYPGKAPEGEMSASFTTRLLTVLLLEDRSESFAVDLTLIACHFVVFALKVPSLIKSQLDVFSVSRWYTGEWGPCSVSCGGGSKLRQVHCVEETNNTKIRVDDIKCGGHKPWFQEACNQIDCPTWTTSKWSGCSVSCGEGVQVREVDCRDTNDKPSTLCSSDTKPEAKKTCSTGIQCPFSVETSEELMPGLYHTQPLVQPYPPPPSPERLIGEQVVPSESTDYKVYFACGWVYVRFIPDDWGPCSVSCGEGVRKREVHCKIFLEFSRTIAKLPDKQCTGKKPIEIEKCYMEPCSSEKMGLDVKDDPYRSDIKVVPGSPAKSYSWKEQGYTHCSATCLGGVQELIVNCVRDDTQKVTSPYMCPIELKPEVLMRTCNDHPCPPRWNYSDFSPCSQSCGIGIQTREVNCIHEVTQGGGNTVIVPNNMCPQPPPPDRQYCNVLDCPVRWKLHEWSRCSKSCGGGEKTRKVECKQVMAQNHSVDRLPSMCPSPKPPETKPCNTKSCIVESDKPHIDVGGAATVFLGTTIKIKCPVKRFNRTKIQWVKDKNYLPKTKKYKTSKKGALRVSNLTLRDSGLYTCIAGKSTAGIQISVRPKPGEFPTSEEIQKQGFKPDRVDLISDVNVNRDDGSPIFADDHSHEQRPDGIKKKPTSRIKSFTPTSPSLRLDTNMAETTDKSHTDHVSPE